MAEPATIVALGDSLTHGYGLPPGDGFVPQLEAWLNEKGAEVTVVNAGVSGDTTAGGRARIGWALSDTADALVVALGGNDLLRGLPPEESRANLTAIMEEAKARNLPVLLIGMQAPGNYGPDYKADFDAIYPDLAAQYDALLAPSFLGALTDLPDRDQTVQDLMQPDGIHPNANGVALIVEDLGPEVLQLLSRVETM